MLDRPHGQADFIENIDEHIIQLKKQITSAITDVNNPQLKENAINTLREVISDFNRLYKECKENYKKIVLENFIISFFILVSIKTNFHLADQLLWWQANKSTQNFTDIDSGLIYCIDFFLKKALENKNKELILERYSEILKNITDLNIDEIHCEKAKKKLTIYKNLALKLEIPQSNPQFDITDLYKLPNMSDTVRLDFKAKMVLEIKKLIEEMENEKQFNNPFPLLSIIKYLSAYLVCGIYISNDNNSFKYKHKKRLLKEHEENFKNKKLELKSLENNSIVMIAKNVTKILTSSFTWDDILFEESFISKTKKLMDELFKEISYITLKKLSADITRQLDYFSVGFNLAYASLAKYIKIHKMSNINLADLLVAHDELNQTIKHIPDYCNNLLIYVYQQQVYGYGYLIKNDHENKDFHKTKLQNNYRNIIKLVPGWFPTVYELYDVKINIYDIDDELSDIVKKFKLDISAISKNNLGNLNLIRKSIYEDVRQYLNRIVFINNLNLQFNEEYNSKLKYPLSDNLMQLINGVINKLQIIGQRITIIYCCLALEQLIKGSEFQNYFPDVYNKIIFETLRRKANQFYDLITYYDFNHTKNPYAKAYIDTIVSIRNHKDYPKIEDTKLLEVYPHLIDAYLEKDNFEQAYFYLLQAISIFPGESSFFEKFNLFKKRMERDKAQEKAEKLSEEYKKIFDEFDITLEQNYQVALEKERLASMQLQTYQRQVELATVLSKMLKNEEKHAQQKVKQAETVLNNLKNQELQLQIQQNKASDDIFLAGGGKTISVRVLKLLFNLDTKLRKLKTNLIFKGSFLVREVIFETIKLFHNYEDPQIARYIPVNDIDVDIPCQSNEQQLAVMNIVNDFGFLFVKEAKDKAYSNFSLNVDGFDIDLTVAQAWYSSHEPMVIRMGRGEFAPIRNKEDYFNFFLDNISNILKGRKSQFLLKVNRFYIIITPPANYEDLYIDACQLKIFPVLNPHKRFSAYCYNIFNYWQKFENIPLNIFNNSNQPLPQSMVSFTSNLTLYDEFFQRLITHFDDQLSIKDYSIYFEMNEFIKKGILPGKEEFASLFISAFYFSVIKDLLHHSNKAYTDKLKSEAIQQIIAKDCAKNFIKIITEQKNKNSNLFSSLESLKNYIDNEAVLMIEDYNQCLKLTLEDAIVEQSILSERKQKLTLSQYYQGYVTFYPAQKMGIKPQQFYQNQVEKIQEYKMNLK